MMWDQHNQSEFDQDRDKASLKMSLKDAMQAADDAEAFDNTHEGYIDEMMKEYKGIFAAAICAAVAKGKLPMQPGAEAVLKLVQFSAGIGYMEGYNKAKGEGNG